MDDTGCVVSLSREDLKGHCCRLCAAKARAPFEMPISFIPLYELCDKAHKYGVPLFKIVNSWLPLTLSPEDSYYPRSICATCFYRMEDTISFFQHILTGQRRLADAINKKSTAPIVKAEPSLVYDAQNEMTKVAKPRGRPRKDKSAPDVKSKGTPLEVSDVSSLPLAARKEKRTAKPPQRFGEEYENPVTRKPKDEANEAEDKSKTDDVDTTTTQTITSRTKPEPVPISLEFTRHMGFELDLNKLDVLMDGDEETEADGAGYHKIPLLNSVKMEPPLKPIDPCSPPVVEQDDLDDVDYGKERKKPKKRKRGVRRRLANIRKRYPCSYEGCLEAFTTFSARRYHFERKHETNIRHFCPTCEKGFTHNRLLKYHMFTHAPEPKFRCDVCPKRFKSKSSLCTHKRTHHAGVERERIPCEVENCGESFTLKSSLKAHLLLHDGIKPHTCPICEKGFTQLSNLRAHERIHNGLRPFKCPIPLCSKTFKTKTQLKMHEGCHEVTKPHLCPTCGKSFRTKSSFRCHMASHSGVKAFGCDICEKRFTTGKALRIHELIHQRKGPLPSGLICFCGMEFPNRKTLLKHRRTCSSGLMQEVSTEEQESEGIVLEVGDAELGDCYGINVLETAEEQTIDSVMEDDGIHPEDEDLIQLEIYNPEDPEGMEGNTGGIRYFINIPRYLMGLVDENSIVHDA